MKQSTTVTRVDQLQEINTDWGQLTWYASAELANSQTMTVGECRIKPGCENPGHHHPNCDEVLVVRQGTILHSIAGEESVEMHEGDVISIPDGVKHNARNIGNDEAVLLICFNAADRKTVGE